MRSEKDFDKMLINALLLPWRIAFAVLFWILAYTACIPLFIGFGPAKVYEYWSSWKD